MLVSNIVLRGLESIGLVAYHLCLVVESLNSAVVNGHSEIVHQVVLASPEDSSEISHGIKEGVSCPPGPSQLHNNR